MSKSMTTSIRLTQDLRNQLEHAAQLLHHGKNWVITQALQEYFSRTQIVELAKEARRQSLLVAKQETQDELWEDNQDTSGWE
jgi:hypothetical protein